MRTTCRVPSSTCPQKQQEGTVGTLTPQPAHTLAVSSTWKGFFVMDKRHQPVRSSANYCCLQCAAHPTARCSTAAQQCVWRGIPNT